jgi:hypothetical protein
VRNNVIPIFTSIFIFIFFIKILTCRPHHYWYLSIQTSSGGATFTFHEQTTIENSVHDGKVRQWFFHIFYIVFIRRSLILFD